MEKFPANIGRLIQQSEQDRRQEQVDWDLCIHFLSGNQWLRYDRKVKDFLVQGQGGGQDSQVTVNLILNMYRSILSRLAIAYPSIAVMPATPSTEDILKAKSSETALRYYWSSADIRKTVETAIEWLLISGTTALHTYYDGEKEEVKTVAHSPYDVVFEPKVIDPEESQWIGIKTYHTKEALKEAYPKYSSFIDESPQTQYDTSLWGDHKPGNRVELYEIYWRDGRHAIMLNNKYVYKEDNFGDVFPIQIIRYTKIPTQLWGLGLIRPLLELQAYYNKARTQMLMNVELMGNPKWIVPKNSGVPKGSFTNRPGEVIYYNIAGGAPTQMQPAPLPGYVLDNIQRIHSEMGDVAGIHSVSLGRRAVGISSGKAIQALSERDMSQLQISQSNIERGVRDMAQCVLSQMKKHYSKSKWMRMMDDVGRVIFHEIKSENLVNSPEIFLEAGSLFRHEAQDRDAKIMELMQMGLIDKEDALKEMSFRTSNSNVTEKIQSMSHAQELLMRATEGYEIYVYRYDDLEAFKEVFSKFMQTEKFYQLSRDKQDYISDVLVSIETFGQGEEAYQQLSTMNTVFPRAVPPSQSDEQFAGNLAAAQSNLARDQMTREQIDISESASSVNQAKARMAKGAEALMTSQKGGGAL